MKIKIQAFFLFLLILSSTGAFAQFWYQQHFDGADTSSGNSIIIIPDTAAANIWQVGKPQKTLFHAASTIPNVLVTDTINYYPVNNISRFSFKYNVQYPWGVLALQWMQKLDMDLHKDGGIIEYSKDTGQTWISVFNNPNILNFYGFQPGNSDTTYTGKRAFSGTDTIWRNIWVCFTPNYFNQMQDIYFRFTLQTDSVNTNKEGWMIDNLMLNLTMLHPVNEMKKAENLKVYPTFTNGIIKIEHPSGKEVVQAQQIELWTVDGKLLEHFTNSNGKFKMDISRHETGMYFLRIITNDRTENHPIMLYKN